MGKQWVWSEGCDDRKWCDEWVIARRADRKCTRLLYNVYTFGNGEYLQWAIKDITGEEETAGSLDWRGVCFKPRGKSMTTHWLKSLWPTLLSGPQLARERQSPKALACWTEWSTLLCQEECVILPCKGIQQNCHIEQHYTEKEERRMDLLKQGCPLILSYIYIHCTLQLSQNAWNILLPWLIVLFYNLLHCFELHLDEA